MWVWKYARFRGAGVSRYDLTLPSGEFWPGTFSASGRFRGCCSRPTPLEMRCALKRDVSDIAKKGGVQPLPLASGRPDGVVEGREFLTAVESHVVLVQFFSAAKNVMCSPKLKSRCI